MSPLARIPVIFRRALPAALLVLGACDESATEPEAPDPGTTLTVDASATEAWALVDLGAASPLVQAADPTASTAWDLGLQTTRVAINGGASGPGGMTAHCLCANAAATPEQVMAMTPESQRAAFESVTADQIPAAPSAWSATALDDNRWYRYNLAGNHQIWPTFDVYLVRRGDEVYKVQFIGYYGADGTPRQISFRYALLAD